MKSDAHIVALYHAIEKRLAEKGYTISMPGVRKTFKIVRNDSGHSYYFETVAQLEAFYLGLWDATASHEQ